ASRDRKLDLAIAGRKQRAIGMSGDDRPPDPAAEGRADRDVLEIWGLARQAAGRRDGLVERRMDPAVAIDERTEALGIRRAQLLDLAVLEDLVDHRMRAAQLLEDRGIGGVTGARPTAARQRQLAEQQLLQLLG